MNEWSQLLKQTHPQFKSMMTVEEALTEEENTLTSEVESKEDPINEIEWISPTHKLQNKIENIPDKFGFKIGEAADYVGVKQYVLRYWETEFDILKPKKSKNGQRMYTQKDVETALLIKKLLHEDRFSIEGAQAALKKLRAQVKEVKTQAKEQIKEAKKEKPTQPAAVNGSPQISLQFAEAMLAQIRQAKLNLNL